MSSLRLWFLGARPRTLGASLAPVLVGTAVGAHYGEVVQWRMVLCLVLAAALQIGVNYANDYSDGVRGVDKDRKGPLRLTASGLVSPASVKRAALVSFAVGALAGLVLAVDVSLWLLVVGAASIAAATLYSGGPKPYASSGLGEVSVLVFFGFVATCGSAFVQLERVPWLAVGASVPVGLLACAILLVNNLRDIASDTLAGKRTLAVRIGAARTVRLYQASFVGAYASLPVLAIAAPWALSAFATLPLAVRPLQHVRVTSPPPILVVCLIATASLQLAFAIFLAAGLVRA